MAPWSVWEQVVLSAPLHWARRQVRGVAERWVPRQVRGAPERWVPRQVRMTSAPRRAEVSQRPSPDPRGLLR